MPEQDEISISTKVDRLLRFLWFFGGAVAAAVGWAAMLQSRISSLEQAAIRQEAANVKADAVATEFREYKTTLAGQLAALDQSQKDMNRRAQSIEDKIDRLLSRK